MEFIPVEGSKSRRKRLESLNSGDSNNDGQGNYPPGFLHFNRNKGNKPHLYSLPNNFWLRVTNRSRSFRYDLMTGRLTFRLLRTVVVALLLVLLCQIVIHILFELPTYYELERISDSKSVERARRAIQSEIDNLNERVVDYAGRDATYNYIAGEGKGPKASHFLHSDIGFLAHKDSDINGSIILDTTGKVVHKAYFDLKSGTSPRSLDVDAGSFDVTDLLQGMINRKKMIISSGVLSSNIGVIMYSASKILNSKRTLPPRGVLIFWRRFDHALMDNIQRLAGSGLQFIPVTAARENPELSGKMAALNASGKTFLPRDEANQLYWLIRDAAGAPIFLVRQNAGLRHFDPGILSLSTALGFVAMAVILILIAMYFSRSVLRRVTAAAATMRHVWRTGDYSNRIPVEGRDELAEMSALFNELLKKIETQEKELRDHNRELVEISQKDGLTGISNRRFFDEAFDRGWRLATRSSRPLSVLLIDVDNFKAFNDYYGHQDGDMVLKQVAETLQNNLQRATDFVARYGGEEFCLILADTGLNDAILTAEKLRLAVRDLRIRHAAGIGEGIVTISLGVASTIPHVRGNRLDLLKHADKALYAAKAAGRDRVHSVEV